jgi:hypothetical protein
VGRRPRAPAPIAGGGLVALALALSVAGLASPALAAGPPVAIDAAGAIDPGAARRVREVIASRRAVREDLALPPAASVSTERAATAQRAASIRLALGRAQKLESEAAWDDCVREAAGALSDAVEVLARIDDLALLRELHLQIGACMTLNQSLANARPHFIAAALLDESQVKLGLHREEAERAEGDARAEVLARSRGRVRIESIPAGAEVWIDGRKSAGTTPLDVEVRLGDHFITTRRFRFEPRTELTVLQPSGVVRLPLDPARRETLREQLSAIVAGSATRPDEAELRLARAVWSRAEQSVILEPAGGALRVRIVDAVSGQALGQASVLKSDDDATLRKRVCDALGETCEATARGVPWYVWPLGGAVLASGAITAGVIASANRSLRVCPSGGCP